MQLGPFELEAIVGRGGMGVVWRARHRHDDAAVAIKLVEGELDPEAFAEEARAVARLHHPHVVQVYDYGTEPTAFLVMELLTGGSLLEIGPTLDWAGVRSVLGVVLDALGHAHARGLLHRDVKPGNILRDADGSWRLVDFGIARAADRPGRIAGTPPYMAPELLSARVTEVGPWSDLYGLGCVAWQLLTGSPPHVGEVAEIRSRALRGPPVLRSRMAMPPGTEAWLERLLDPSPEGRFARAADALWALASLGPAPRRVEEPEPEPYDPASTFTLDALTQEVDAPVPAPARDSKAVFARPTCPAKWTDRPRPDAQPRNLGLGLFGLREIPFAGRHAERTALWNHLVAVCRAGETRVVWLTGGPGIGKTRLARWLVRLADELGVASAWTWRADLRGMVHGRLPLPAKGGRLTHALARRLDLDPEAPLVGACQRWLEGERLPLTDEAVLVEAFLRAESHVRPVVLHVDEVDEAARTLVERLAGGDTPILVLLCSREEPPAGLDMVRELLGPMSEGELRQVVRGTIGVEDRLAVEVAERAAGNPRFVHDLVASWVDRGWLEAAPEGYRLTSSEALPTDVASLARQRLAEWLVEPASRDRMELAAILGSRVDQGEWQAACVAAELDPDAAVVATGLRRGLLFPVPGGFAFGDAELHATLRSDTDPDRGRRWHRAAADVLDPQRHPARVATHLLGAEDPEAAAKPLHHAARRAHARGDFHGAIRHFERYEALLERLGRGETRERADAVGWRAWLRYQLGEFDEALEDAARALAMGEALGDPGVIGSALHTRGVVLDAAGLDGALEALKAAVEGYTAAGQIAFAVSARLAAILAEFDGQEALVQLEELLRTHGDTPDNKARILRLVALAAADAGDFERALRDAYAAEAMFAERGVLTGTRACRLITADTHYRMGDLESAARDFRFVKEVGTDDRDARYVEAELGLAVIELHRRQFAEAGTRLRRNAGRVQHSWVNRRSLFESAMLAVYAAEGDTAAFDAAIAGMRGIVKHNQHTSVLPVCRIAAELWEERGDLARRDRTLVLIRAHEAMLTA